MRILQSFLLIAVLTGAIRADDAPLRLLSSEFIYETAPFPSCHASSIAETPDGRLVATWFGGTAEKNPDVGIWVSRHADGRWSAPVEVANEIQPDGKRHPCWNPVLFQPKSGDLLLFYKVGPSPVDWWGMLRTSADGGQTWGAATRLPEGILGPIKNKPIQLADGAILCGSSAEGLSPPPSWQIHFEITPDLGKTWKRIAVPTSSDGPPSIQPSILTHGGGHLQAVGRTRSSKVFSTFSSDQGQTWEAPRLLALPNPNSGTDAVTLRDGRHLLIYNHTEKGRTPLNLAISRDGIDWQPMLALESEPGEYSYPAIVQTSDGRIHATYTWKRKRVKHAVLEVSKLTAN